MKFRRNFFSRMYRNDEPGDEGSGLDATATDLAPDGPDAGAIASPDDSAAAPLTPEAKTKAMADAMFPTPKTSEQEQAAEEQRARDAQGKFAKKPTDPTAPVDPKDPTKKPAVDPKELTVMPEGLTPKAQERFQALANTNKELTGRLEAATALAGGNPDAVVPMLQSAQALQQTFQQHGVTRDQFTQATEAIGLLNRGDMAGFQRMLENQLRQVSLATGKPIGQVDALAEFPDLREKVDSLQLTEQDAIEMARNRATQQTQRQQQQRQQQEQQQEQAGEQANHAGRLSVDEFCKKTMKTDLDYARIEPILLQQIKDGLLDEVPPNRWAAIVEKTYGLIKQTSVSARTGQPSMQVLRPNGGGSPKEQPKSAYEAMWGTKKPVGA